MTDLIDLAEIPALIHSRTGLELSTRKVLYMAANGLFPKPAVHVHRKLIRFSRRDVLDWTERAFPNDDKKHKPRDHDAREKMLPTSASRRRS